MKLDTNLIYHGDCYNVLKRQFPAGDAKQGIDLIYLDPPFSFDPEYAKLWYDKEALDVFEEIRKGGVKHFTNWMAKRLEQCRRVLKDTGSIYLHCDWKFGHYLKVEMDNIFGRNNFQNELIWYYRGGGVSKKRFGRKHDTIFFYTKQGGDVHTFNFDDIRQQYSKSVLESSPSRYDKSYRKGKVYSGYRPDPKGKYPDDVLQIQPIMPSDKTQRIGWATQKPKALLEVIIKASSNPDDIVLDPMCGCGTTIAAAYGLGRKWIGIDISSQACEEMQKRMYKLGITDIEIKGLPLTVKDLKKIKPFEFQDYICEMTDSVKPQRKSADEGIDGFYLGEHPIQVKQQEGVGRKVIDEFETALRRKSKNKGYVVGFSFTKNAHEEAARAKDDKLDIKLISIDDLIRRDYELE